MNSSSRKMWRWTFLILGLSGLCFGSYLVYQYYMLKVEMLDSSNAETVWHEFGLIFAFAGVGSYLLAIGLVAIGLGLMLLIIAIIIWRR